MNVLPAVTKVISDATKSAEEVITKPQPPAATSFSELPLDTQEIYVLSKEIIVEMLDEMTFEVAKKSIIDANARQSASLIVKAQEAASDKA